MILLAVYTFSNKGVIFFKSVSPQNFDTLHDVTQRAHYDE
jgi:hypothetical protein